MEEETIVTPEEKKPNFFGIGLVLTLVVLVVLMVLSGKKEPIEDNKTAEVAGTIAVEAGSFYYKPNLIRAKKGEKVKLTLNSVSMVHDFNIDELGIRVPITQSGNSSSVEFTVNEVGEFEFYCSVGQHRANGQIGKLIVVE